MSKEPRNLFRKSPGHSDDDGETYNPSSWRMPDKVTSVPTIAVNEKAFKLPPELEPQPSISTLTTTSAESRSTDISDILTNLDSRDDEDDENLVIRQKLIRVRDDKNDDSPGIHHHLKLWRRKLVILIWLNFLMRYRKTFQTYVEIFFPVFAFAIIGGSMIMNNLYSVHYDPYRTDKKLDANDPFHPFNTMERDRILKYACANSEFCAINPYAQDESQKSVEDDVNYYIVYSPNNSFVSSIMESAKQILGYKVEMEKSRYFGVATKQEVLEETNKKWNEQDQDVLFPMGIIFSFSDVTDEQLLKIERNEEIPKKLKYTVRTYYAEIANTAEGFPFIDHSAGPRTRHEVSSYIITGFAGMQLAIDLAYVERVKEELKAARRKAGRDPEQLPVFENTKRIDDMFNSYAKSFRLKMFEYPYYLDKETKSRCWLTVVITVILSYVCTNFAETQELVRETRLGKMELLKLHGLTPALHWISYGINMTVLGTISGAFMAVIFYYCFEHQSILTYQSPGWVWMLLFLYGVAQTTDNYFFALFFKSPTTGGMACVFKCLLTFVIPMKLFVEGYMTRVPNLLLCLILPQWCLANGIYSYLQYEIYESGLDWFDFPVLIDTKNNIVVSLPICCIILIYTAAIYLLLTIYADRVFAKPYAPAKTWLHFWKNRRDLKPENQKPSLPINLAEMPKLFELPPFDMPCTIRIRNLCKTIESEKSYEISLDNINLDIVEGEILGILGPAGSGKTCLLHLIAGLTKPTSGFVEMKNLKVHEHSDYLNQFISVCTQKCMLFPTLSVEDHVRLCCMVHGVSYRKSKVQAKMLLQLFNLLGFKRHDWKYLSSTLKKKLAMAMALASSPTILILDEICQGMDSDSAKQFWKYLTSLKTKRTIIISSSRMEDIELYCDRVLLLVNGKTVCYGPPNRVKKHYDIGSIVNILEGPIPLKTSVIEKIINTEVRGSLKLNSLGSYQKTRRYMLPFGESYAALIENIEDSSDILQYAKMWISLPELGSVLHKIALSKGLESALATKEDFIGASISGDVISQIKKTVKEVVPKPVQPNRTIRKNFEALYRRKWLTMTQKHKLLVTEFFVPLLMMMLVMSHSPDFLQHTPESLPITLDIGLYNGSLTLIRPKQSDSYRHKWYEAYQHALGHAPTMYVSHKPKSTIMSEIEKRKNLTLTNSRQQTIIAFEQDDQQTIAYYSTNSFHSCPIALNTMANAFLYIISQEKEQDRTPENMDPYKIRISNHPVHQYEGFNSGSTASNSMIAFAFLVSVILAFVAAAELRLPIWEKINGIKNLELMAGVSPSVYWFTSACGDCLMNMIIVVIMMGIICLIDIYNQQFVGAAEKNYLALIFFVYLCWASIPCSYFLSLVLKTTHNGYSHFLILHFVLGIFPNSILYQVLRAFFEHTPLHLRYFFHLFPQYSITSALIHYLHITSERNYCMDKSYKSYCKEYKNAMKYGYKNEDQRKHLEAQIDSNTLFRSCCKVFCKKDDLCHVDRDYFLDARIPALSADICAMIAQGIFYWALVLAIEQNLPQSAFNFVKTKLVGDKEIKSASEDSREREETEDVKKEHTKVDYMIDIEDNVESEVFLVQDVTKFHKDHKSIDHVYFSIPIKKTSAVLGPSKSGLTTLMKLITGQIRTSAGYIYMDNERMMSKNNSKLTEKIGYLPEESAYYPHLTGFQMLQLFGKLRGIPDSQLDVQVNRWLSVLDLQTDAKMTCKSYRPGVLRRLCCAMAMIGNPRIVLMDEPTKDMDLRERYIFWTAIKQARDLGQTTCFTSTFAEEVHNVSNKAMVLDHGVLVAIGPPQDVFKASSRGFLLSLRCKTTSFKKLNAFQIAAKIDQLRDHVIRHLSPCELLFDEGNILIYQLKDLTTKLSYAYGIMEGAREKFPNLLDNFLIAEPSLDDVVLNLQKSKRKKRASSQEGGNDGENRDSL